MCLKYVLSFEASKIDKFSLGSRGPHGPYLLLPLDENSSFLSSLVERLNLFQQLLEQVIGCIDWSELKHCLCTKLQSHTPKSIARGLKRSEVLMHALACDKAIIVPYPTGLVSDVINLCCYLIRYKIGSL